MSAEDMVGAALVGLDQAEVITIPRLPDGRSGPVPRENLLRESAV
jgi:hypothetical protein